MPLKIPKMRYCIWQCMWWCMPKSSDMFEILEAVEILWLPEYGNGLLENQR